MSKTLTIKESTYQRLGGLKMEGESFSDLLDRLASRSGRDSFLALMGTVDLDPAEAQSIIDEIYAKRQERRP